MHTVFKCQGKIAGFLGLWIFATSLYLIYLRECNILIFFNVGPSKTVHFVGIVIDNWGKWYLMMGFTIVTQILKMLADEIISPWIINTIMDDKSNDCNLQYYESQAICQTYYLFSAMVKIVQISISITQIDFIIVFIMTDIIISIYTTHMYLKSKNKTDGYQTLISKSYDTFT